MLGDISGVENLFLITGATDMRKSIDGLCAVVEQVVRQDAQDALAGVDGEIRENLIRLGQLVDAKDTENIANLCVILQRQIEERGVKLKMSK